MSRNRKILTNNHEIASGSRVNWLDEFADKKLGNVKEASHKRIDWLDRFADQVSEEPKTAVEVARERNHSILDQINSILNGNQYTVEGVVRQYQKDTGLEAYLQRLSNSKEQNKTASHNLPSLDQFGPKVKQNICNTIDNTIETHHGYCSVPAVIYDVLSLFAKDGVSASDLQNDDVVQYISDMIAEQQRNHPIPEDSQQLGRGVADESDDDDQDSFLSSIQNM